VAERFGAGGVQETRGGLTVPSGAVGCNADRDLFLDLFFLPRPVVLLALTSIKGERAEGGDGAGFEDN
jgi:hypothetical protein